MIDITKDAQFGLMQFFYEPCTEVGTYIARPEPVLSRLKEAAQLIDGAERPFLLAGQGVQVAGAEQELLAFAEKTGIPVACTLLGLSVFPPEHELYTGMLGMHGHYAANMKTNECDVLLAVGMRFDDRVTGDLSRYARQAKVIHIDIDGAELGKNVPVHVPVHADAKDALVALTRLCQTKKYPERVKGFKEAEGKEFALITGKELFRTEDKLCMAEVINRLWELTQGSTVVVTDVGQHQMVTARYYRYKEKRSSITSGGLGTMGFALPAAIGAKMACPSREIIAVIGDGGFQMTMQEPGTLADTGVSVKIIILNNRFLGMVRQWQELFFEKRYAFARMNTPDFVLIAKAYGICSAHISTRDQLDEGLLELLNNPQSHLLEIMVEMEENVFPMVPSGASVSEMILTD